MHRDSPTNTAHVPPKPPETNAFTDDAVDDAADALCSLTSSTASVELYASIFESQLAPLHNTIVPAHAPSLNVVRRRPRGAYARGVDGVGRRSQVFERVRRRVTGKSRARAIDRVGSDISVFGIRARRRRRIVSCSSSATMRCCSA